jgi:hypothetical protein
MSYSVARASTGDGSAGRLRMTPGRIAALAIGVPVALMLIAWTGIGFVGSLLGQASFPVSYRVPVSHGQVTAQVAGGNITLRQAPVSAAELKGTAEYSLLRPTVTASQTATGTMVGFDCHAFPIGNCSLDATLVVPLRTPVSLSTGGGDLRVSDFTGDLTLNTYGGTVTAGNLTGQLIQLHTGGGDLQASALNGQVQLTSDGGTVTVNAMAATPATVQSGGGDVRLTFTQVPGKLRIISDGGTVMLVLPHGNARYNIVTTPDGGTVSDSVPTDSSATNTIVVQSGGGDINITEAS